MTAKGAGPGPSAPLRVLVVMGAPNARFASQVLLEGCAAMRDHLGAHVEVWYLRRGHKPPYAGRVWDGPTRCIDHLRTWWPAVLAGIGGQRTAGVVRGWQLRRWMRSAAPDLVILDDGQGARAVPGIERVPAIVVRRSGEEPLYGAWEDEWTGRVDLVIDASEEGAREAGGAWLPRLTTVKHRVGTGPLGPVPTIVGVGTDSWLDGADLFVRVLWHLEHHHRLIVRGRWHLTGSEPSDRERLLEEADRCGVADRLELVEGPIEVGADDAPVICVPARLALLTDELLALVVEGAVVVTFYEPDQVVPGVIALPPFDVPGLADAVAATLARHPDDVVQGIIDAMDADRFAERVVEGVAGRLGSG
ncbi:MAG: hypothetical protein U0P45_02220 [Acidimicrobiales bacterium]